MNGSGERLPLLDGVRGLAIALVFVNNLYPEHATGTTLDTLFVHFSDFWWIGVDLFFVLSGFLITSILLDTKDGAHFFRNFYARRFLRIFPLYYLALFVLFYVVPHAGLATPAQFARLEPHEPYLWTYLGNLGYAIHGDSHFHTTLFWSLAVEEQFYLVWPFFVWLLDRRRLIAFCLTMMTASLVLRLAWRLAGLSSEWVYALTPFRFDGLAVGALIALVLRAPDGRAMLQRWARPVWRTCAPLALVLIALYELPRNDTLGIPLQVIGYPALALAFGAVIVFCLDAQPGSRLARFFGSRTMRFLGVYSYGMYVWHGLVHQLSLDQWPMFDRPPRVLGSTIPLGIADLIILSAATTAIAFVSYHLYEKRFLSLKRFFPYVRAVHPAGPPGREPAGAVAVPAAD